MCLKNLFRSLTEGFSRRRPSRRRPRSVPLHSESLEIRRVLSYSVVDLGTLGGTHSQATDINDAGQVVGVSLRSDYGWRAFLWQDGVMTDLGTLGGDYSRAVGINDVGQIVGHSFTGDGTDHAFLLTPEDTDGNGAPDHWFRDSNTDGKNDLMLDLGPNTVANDLNNAGQVVGHSGPAGAERAFRWQDGILTDLGTLGGSTSSATAINDAGQIAGISLTATGESAAFLWQSGVMYDIGALGGATDINRSGQVAVTGPWQTYATLWTPTTANGATGSLQSLGALPPDYYGQYESVWTYSVAAGVNDLGTVVGSSLTVHSYADEFGGYFFETSQGFLWSDGVMEGLPELPGATAINNAGQIVGNGQYSYGEIPTRAFLLTPGSPPPPSVHVDDVTITEGNSGTRTVVFTVRLSEASSQTVSVNYATANGSASAGSDYQSASGTVSFAPGQVFQTISIPIVGDRAAEANETFLVNLGSPTNATIGDGQATGTIVDDEPRITISDVTKAEGRKGKTTLFTFTVTLSAAYDQPVTMSYRTVNGTATTGNNDYVAKSGTLTFAPGETTRTITITVKGDSRREPTESFYLDLFGNSGNALFARKRGIGTILNDD